MRKILTVVLIIVLAYIGIGLGFHFKWTSELAACRDARTAQGEFVEPEVFDNAIGLIFDVALWPIYSVANIYHDRTPFATPCTGE